MKPKRDSFRGCWKCGGDTPMLEEVSLLANIYAAKLCADCVNDWALYLDEHPAWLAFSNVMDARQIIVAQSHADGEDRTADLQANTKTLRQAERELFRLAEAWVETLITRPPKSVEQPVSA